MLAWSEGTDNGRQKTRNHGYDVIAAESYLLITRSPSQTCHAKPKNSTQEAIAGSSSSQDAYRKQLGLKDFSPKSQDAVALQQIKERGALP